MEDRFNLSRKIFVGNISYRVNQNRLTKFFRKFGSVEYCYLVKDHLKKWSRGIAFITFSNRDEADTALRATSDQLHLDGRQMRVSEAEESKRYSYIEKGYWQPKNQDMQPNNSSQQNMVSQVEQNQGDVTADDCTGNDLVEQIQGDVTADDCTGNDLINSLNDHMLSYIFSCLPILDRIRIERVCHRWYTVAQQSWTKQHTLQFQNVFKGFTSLTDSRLCAILHRCGPYLKCLDLSASSTLLTDMSIDAVAQRCPNLRQIDMSSVSVTEVSLKRLAQACPNIQWVRLKNCCHIKDRGLAWLLERCNKLQYLDVSSSYQVRGTSFSSAGSEIRTLHLNKCYKLKDNGIYNICRHCPNLNELQISECTALTNNSLQIIAKYCKHLKCLDLSNVPTVSVSGMKELHSLWTMESLNLSQNPVSVDDGVLCAIAEGCPNLKSLNISECHRYVTDNGLQSLARCSDLTELNISYIHTITDNSIIQISRNGRLRRFMAKACSRITDDSIQVLAEMCHHIEFLDLSGNCFISNLTLVAVIKSLSVENVEHMTVNIGGTSIVTDDVVIPNNIDLCLQDLSQPYLRGSREIILPADDEYDEESEYNEDHPSVLEYGILPAGAEYFIDNGWTEMEDDFDNDDILVSDDPLEMERWEYS